MSFEDPRISHVLMIATYLLGIVGIAIGFTTVNDEPPSLSIAAALAVGGGGVLSWLRHSIFHRSDAKRMGWDLGHRNGFQIETGIANLAWGLVALAAVIFGWGIKAEAATILIFGAYLAGCSVMVLLSPPDDRGHRWGAIAGMVSAGVVLIILGVQGMNA